MCVCTSMRGMSLGTNAAFGGGSGARSCGAAAGAATSALPLTGEDGAGAGVDFVQPHADAIINR